MRIRPPATVPVPFCDGPPACRGKRGTGTVAMTFLPMWYQRAHGASPHFSANLANCQTILPNAPPFGEPHDETICRRLILASRSPRRRELLAAAGYDFDVCIRQRSGRVRGVQRRIAPSACRPAGLSEGGRRGPADRDRFRADSRLRHRGRVRRPDSRQTGRRRPRPDDARNAQWARASRTERRLPLACARRPADGPRGRHDVADGRAFAAAARRVSGRRPVGRARPARSATRTVSIGSTSSKAASRTSSACRWNCWPRCWPRCRRIATVSSRSVSAMRGPRGVRCRRRAAGGRTVPAPR